MAPPNGATKARKGPGSKQMTTKPVVPAIPLPLIQRKPPTHGTAVPPPSTSNHKSNGSASTLSATGTSGPTTPSSTETKPDTSKALLQPPVVNGRSTAHSAPPSDRTSSPNGDSNLSDSGKHPDAEPGEFPTPKSKEKPTPAVLSDAEGPALAQNPGEKVMESLSVPPNQDPQSRRPATRQASSTMSLPRYQMPPSFQSANRPPNFSGNGEASRAHRPQVLNNTIPIHQPNPSNGGLQFGGLHDSKNSSPAPHSAGFAPPSGMAVHDARASFPAHNPTGDFGPPMVQYGPEMMAATADGYGRPLYAYTPVDNYPLYVNNYGPSTPHSFHDSQSSAHADEPGPYGQFTGAVANGAGHIEDIRAQPQPGHSSRMSALHHRILPGPMPPPHVLPPDVAMQRDDLHGYVRSLFQETAFADCYLELRYADDHAPPVRIPGHRVILARSEGLKRAMLSDSPSSIVSGMSTVLLQTDDKYVRSDAFITAVQNLYGFALFTIPDPPPGSEELQPAGSAVDRFNFVLGYAAAGHLLRRDAVVLRGMEMACQQLSWNTLERALEFALGDGAAHGVPDMHSQYRYGEPVRILLNGIATFLVNSFPPGFILDTSVPDPEAYGRLPKVPLPPQAPKEPAPAIARGTTVNLSQSRRSHLSHIKFGDLSPAVVHSPGASTGPSVQKAAHPAPPHFSTLSRVLINLPFPLLKTSLESGGQGTVLGWANAEARHQVIRDVVAERELRRLRAVEAIKAGAVENASSIEAALRSPEPRSTEEWDVMGWREELVPYGNPDGPCLGRTWTPLVGGEGCGDLSSLSSAQYP